MGKKKKKYDKDLCHIYEEVNQCDKYFGIKLKHPNVMTEPSQVFETSILSSQKYIESLIVALNGIDVDDYFDVDETYSNIFEDIEFTDLSDLDWRAKDVYPVNSLKFKCRFLTVVLSEMETKIDRISRQQQKATGCGAVNSFEMSYMNLKNNTADLKRLTMCMLHNKVFGKILLKVIFHESYAKKKLNAKKYNTIVFTLINDLISGTRTDKFINKTPYLDDDLVINHTMRLAYMLTTYDTDTSSLPKFKHLEGATRKDDLCRVIVALGSAIMKAKKYNKRSIVYKAFNEARPCIMTNYSDVNDNIYLSVGIRALVYTDFILNDKWLHKFIEDMINK